MSLGFGVGDFIAVVDKAKRIRKDFVNAPTQFKDISRELRSLHIILEDIEVVLPGQELINEQKAELHDIADGCRTVLKELEESLVKYEQVSIASGGISDKAKRVWKRLKWEPEDIREFRSRIVANIILLRVFQDRLDGQTALATKVGVDQLNERQNDRERCEEHQAILGWITPVDYATQQSDLIGRRQEGTGQWLLDSDEFKIWLNQSNQILFFSGIPGSGKTICASIVINELQARFRNDASVGIAYIYCNFRRNREQKAVDLLASLLKQFSQGLSFVPQSLRRLYESHRSLRTRPSFDEISQTLQSVVSECSRAFVIIDALDECQDTYGDRKRLLTGLSSLQRRTGACLLTTSRSNPNFEKDLQGRSTRMEIRASEPDLKRYIDEHITRLPAFVSRNADLQCEIETAIIGAVDGMFLLAQLHLDSLVGKPSPKGIRSALAMLPRGSQAYDEAYSEAMMRIGSQIVDSQELARRALSWITCAKRPLTSTELRYALAVESNEPEFDDQNLTEIADVLNVCAGLITVDEESGIVRLIHYTTQEYFERTWCTWFSGAQKEITETCVTYLSFDAFGNGACPTDGEFETRLRSNPLYDYAARNWGHHAHAASTEGRQSILEFLGKETIVSSSTQAMMAPVYHWEGYSQCFPKQLTGVHLAAHFGLTDIIAALLDIGHQPNCKDSWGRTPLLLAASKGHLAAVRLLVDRTDVEIDSKDQNGLTPLSWAARDGHEEVVKFLVHRGDVEADSKDQDGRTPLSWAASNGLVALINLFVDRIDVDVNSKDKYGRTPLLWTARNGHEAAVKLLLDRIDVVVDSKDQDGQTALSWAARDGHEVVVKLLAERTDIETDSKDQDGRTPLLWAAREGHEAVVMFLLDSANVKADSKDHDGRTPLSWAASNGREAVVKLLVDRQDVDADSRDQYGQTPLSWAARDGHEAVVKLLIDRTNVEADSKDLYCWTPLSWAAATGYEAVVNLLLDRPDVDADSKDLDDRTPLIYAAENGHDTVVKLLIKRADVDANIKDETGRTPLSWAAEYAHEAVVKLLIERCDVDVDSEDKNGRTPLSWAAANGSQAVIKLLVERAAIKVDFKDLVGRTPLSRAAGNGHEAVVALLLNKTDVEADSSDEECRTPLSWAAANGHEGTVKLFIDLPDVDADSKDQNGWTPLSWAAATGFEAVVKLLVDRSDVDADSKDEDCRTPLSWASGNGHGEVVKLLINLTNVKADSKDKYGRTPLSRAGEYGHVAVVQFLVSRPDVDANSKDQDGRTPLSWAAEYGQEAVVKLLLERADVNTDSSGQNGRTPLSWAAENGYEEVVHLLLDCTDVDADSKDQYGRTPLSWAARSGYERVVKLLLERTDVDANSKDEIGRTPLTLAVANGHEAIVKLLVNRPDVDADSVDQANRTPLLWVTKAGFQVLRRS